MDNNIKYLIREISPECMDTSYFFDDDGLTNACGFEYQLFIISKERGRYYGFNADNYRDIVTRIDDFIDDFTVNRERYETRKSVMEYYEIKYNPTLCHKLTEYAEKVPYISNIDQVAEFLTLTTGRRWNTSAVRGYSQGDYVELLYCEDIYKASDAETSGEIYLGCCKEFSVSEIDTDGNEIDTCYGFFVADSQITSWKDSDTEYKRIVCEYAGIDINAATLELITGSRTETIYSYRAV